MLRRALEEPVPRSCRRQRQSPERFLCLPFPGQRRRGAERRISPGRILAGPFATMNLGDLGAEVIKVERPGAGDDTRAWGPPFAGTESVYFLSVNRNKKSIAINMKDSKGVKLIKELAAASDVFVENFVPGKLAEMGLGYEDIKKIAPHIVYCSITVCSDFTFLVSILISCYGQTGPVVQRGGYDSIAAAVSGLMHITGHEDGEPVRSGVAMTDLATGLYTYGAIMAGLLQRYKTGKGLHIDCNLLSTQSHPIFLQINPSSQLSVIHKFTNETFNSLIHVINKNIGQSWPQHRPLKDTTGDWPPAGCNNVHHHSLGLAIQPVPNPAKSAPVQAMGCHLIQEYAVGDSVESLAEV
ncbi:hypothetical protein DUI87_18661 [Hirundo rustica rustica]|uniref:Succinyl-CoA:glutarate-CoA transferase n=1 Tax=Hirundo rustica rustica TaxID=333673 RepID=A0A3M0JXH3_HIRRU|nr:hypothetical protein DUI87_18661 [Hirundo rustica rustica]